jgi:hypothetical protein
MLVVLLLIGAKCPAADGFHCERSVDVIVSKTSDALKLNVALGDVLSLELPEDVALRGEPALGNEAIFDVKVVADPLRILVWPKLPPQADGSQESLHGARSNLQLFLDAGITLVVELRIAPAERAVQHVRFRFPEREAESVYVRQRIADETKRLEADYQERRTQFDREIADVTRDRLAREMLVHADCTSLRRREMHDLVVLRTHRICRIGGDVFVTFSLQNRSRDVFAVERIEVQAAGSESAVEAARSTYEGQLVLSFDQTVRGVIAWPIQEELEPVAEWTLIAVERAGRKRVVRLEDVGF